MNLHHVKYSKGQFKIQQMVFIIVALIILFGIVSVFFVSIRFGELKTDVESLRKEAVLESVRKLAGTPEFAWIMSDDCASCVDMDKLILLKNRTSYKGFYKDISLLKISRIYPTYSANECTLQNYPDCNTITLIQGDNYEGYEAFVSLCGYDGQIGDYKCELGKIIMGFEGVK